MSDTQPIAGTNPVDGLTVVTADQETIIGDGSAARPLRANPDNSLYYNPIILDEGVDVVGAPHRYLNFKGAGVTATNAGGGVVDVTIPGGGVTPDFSMFFGLTGTVAAPIPTDYAATIAVKTGAGTGRVPFPQLGPTSGGISIAIGGTLPPLTAEVNIPAIGTYEVSFKVHTTEPGQLALELNGAMLARTVTPNMNPTAGGHPFVCTAFVTTTVVNSKLAVINPVGNSPALTITPADGASFNANAQSLVIKRIA